MFDYRMMWAVGAAALISMGPARAIEPVDGPTAAAQRQPARAEAGREPFAAARAKVEGVNGDAPDYVRRDELEEVAGEVAQRLERAREAQLPAPTFTDAG